MTKNEATKLKALIKKHVEAQIEAAVLKYDEDMDPRFVSPLRAPEAKRQLDEYIENCIRLE
jgi:hypothetical protein